MPTDEEIANEDFVIEETPQEPEVQAEEAIETEAPESTDTAELGEDEVPKKTGVEARIGELSKKAKDAEIDREAAKKEMEYWKNQALNKQNTPAAAVNAEEAPKQENYPEYDDYISAKAKYEANRAVAEANKRQEEERQQEARQREIGEVQAEIGRREAIFKQSNPDYEQVAGAMVPMLRPELVGDIAMSDKGPDIIYHLGNNPQEMARINSLDRMQAAREIGRLEATLSAAPVSQPNKVTNAPAPIAPVGSNNSATKNMNKMSIDDWMKERNRQTAGA